MHGRKAGRHVGPLDHTVAAAFDQLFGTGLVEFVLRGARKRQITWNTPGTRAPPPMSPAGTSVSSPMCRCSSTISDWQKRMTSRSDLPLGLKFAPPLAPPIGSPVSAFLKHCSKPRNLRMLWFTE